MTTARIGTIAWVAIYAGMALVALGLSMRRSDADAGSAVAVLGGVCVAAGAVLVWVRSRMHGGDGS